MHTPSPAAGNAPQWRGQPRQAAFRWPRNLRYATPVAVIALYGVLWIALHTKADRGSTHIIFQSLALAETTLALLLRRRKPVGALSGILAAYLLFALDPLLLPAVLFALLTVAAARDHRTVAIATTATAAALAAQPYIRGDAVSLAGYSLPRLAAAGAAAAVGLYLRARRNRPAVHPTERPVQSGTPAAAKLARERGESEPHGHPRTSPAQTGHAMADAAKQSPTSAVPAMGTGAASTTCGDHNDS